MMKFNIKKEQEFVRKMVKAFPNAIVTEERKRAINTGDQILFYNCFTGKWEKLQRRRSNLITSDLGEIILEFEDSRQAKRIFRKLKKAYNK